MVAVVKCRVSINGEMREGGGAGRRGGWVQVTAVGQWCFTGGGVGGAGRGRNVSSQQAGVVTSACQTNKLLTQIHLLHRAILKHTQCSRQSVTAQKHHFPEVVIVVYI